MHTTAPARRVVGVIPALDAAATIDAVVQAARRHLARVLVVDDGSTDDTAARAVRAGAEVLQHPANRGKGAALATAFARLLDERQVAGGGAAADTAFAGALTLDADGQHDPADIPMLLERFARDRPAIVIGSRDRHFAAMWWPRRAMNRFSSAAMRFFAGVDLPDTQSGFRLYDARFLERAPGASSTLGRGYEAETRLLMRAARLRLPIASVPIRPTIADGRATSHYRTFTDTFRIIGAVLGERFGGREVGP